MNEWKYVGAVHLKDGTLLSNGFTRIVHGDRGDYVEIHSDQMCEDALFIPDEQQWRVEHRSAYYIEYRTKLGVGVKVYYQKRGTDYADYRVGMYYVSPVFLSCFEVRGAR